MFDKFDALFKILSDNFFLRLSNFLKSFCFSYHKEMLTFQVSLITDVLDLGSIQKLRGQSKGKGS